jgi:uncharacterized hydrophobic protein (TIGR00271 family)
MDPGSWSRASVEAAIDQNSGFDVAFVTMNVLATVVACYGLLENSPAVVIGAMIIAMLLGPIAGISLGLVQWNNRLLRKALRTLAAGIAVVYSTAFALGLVHSEFPLTTEIYARTVPNLMDLLIALAAGGAGAYAMVSPRLSAALVGAAISTALVPPLSASAICLGRGEYRLSYGALLLAVANIVGIQSASSFVMLLCGFRPQGATPDTGSQVKRCMPSLLLLLTLAALLGVSLHRGIRKELYESAMRKGLEAAESLHTGAHFTEMRVRQEADRAVVVATYRTPTAFTPHEVAAIEASLPPRPGAQSTELRVRSIPVMVASKDGFLYLKEDTVAPEGQP